MTSGSITVGGNPHSGLSPPGYRFSRVWSGSDGKTEPYAGGVRTKWNTFDCDVGRRQTNSDQAVYRWWNNFPAKPPVWTDNSVTVPSSVFGPLVSWSSNDTLAVMNKLVQKVKAHDFNLAVNLAQMSMTVDTLASNLKKLGKSMLALKRGDFSTAARQLGTAPRTTSLKGKDVSGRWLELQYGWLPLIGDSYQAAKAFEAISKGPRRALVKVGTSKKRSDKDGTTVNGFVRQRAYHAKKMYLQYEMYEEMSVPRQLGLEDPASVLWENTPYSFVVDWFIPIGTYLENLNAIPSLRGRFLTTEVDKRYGFDYEWVPPAVNPERFIGQKLPNVTYTRTITERVPSSALSPPLPRFNLEGSVHGRRLWNAISLAHQAFF